MTSKERSPLMSLVLFIICLAVAGSVLAEAHYYAVDRPAQDASAHQSPENAATMEAKCKNCQLACSYAKNPIVCLNDCDMYC